MAIIDFPFQRPDPETGDVPDYWPACPVCNGDGGRMHHHLGTPPWALSHDDLCFLSRTFNAGANLGRSQDVRIND